MNTFKKKWTIGVTIQKIFLLRKIIFQLDSSLFEWGDNPLRNPILLGVSLETLFTSH